jgi:hypothetical protein
MMKISVEGGKVKIAWEADSSFTVVVADYGLRIAL